MDKKEISASQLVDKAIAHGKGMTKAGLMAFLLFIFASIASIAWDVDVIPLPVLVGLAVAGLLFFLWGRKRRERDERVKEYLLLISAQKGAPAPVQKVADIEGLALATSQHTDVVKKDLRYMKDSMFVANLPIDFATGEIFITETGEAAFAPSAHKAVASGGVKTTIWHLLGILFVVIWVVSWAVLVAAKEQELGEFGAWGFLIAGLACMYIRALAWEMTKQAMRANEYAKLISIQKITKIEGLALATSRPIDAVSKELRYIVGKKLFTGLSVDFATGDILVVERPTEEPSDFAP